MFKSLKNPCALYTILWCVYNTQGVLYASGSLISQTTLAMLLLWSLVDAGRLFNEYAIPKFLKSLRWILMIILVYGFIAYLTDGATIRGKADSTPTIDWFKMYLMSILPIFSYYYYAKKGYLTSKWVCQWMLVFSLVVLCAFFNGLWQMRGGQDVDDGVTNNAGYFVLSFMPLLLLMEKRMAQYFFMSFCIVLIIFAMKRGAIIGGSLVAVLLLLHRLKDTSKQKKILVIMSIAILLCGLFYFISDFYSTNTYFQYRLEATKEGNASGRDDIYETLLNHILSNGNLFGMIFGEGALATTKITWTAAHNDWLEFMVDMGLIGFVSYVVYWGQFAKLTINKSLTANARFGLALLAIIYFLKTLVSMSLSDMTFLSSMAFGLFLADSKLDEIRYDKNTHSRRFYSGK